MGGAPRCPFFSRRIICLKIILTESVGDGLPKSQNVGWMIDCQWIGAVDSGDKDCILDVCVSHLPLCLSPFHLQKTLTGINYPQQPSAGPVKQGDQECDARARKTISDLPIRPARFLPWLKASMPDFERISFISWFYERAKKLSNRGCIRRRLIL